MSNYEMPKCPMGHEMELLQVASGGWRYGCAKCATSYKVQKRAHYGWLSPIKSTKERAYEAAVKRPMQKPLTVEELNEGDVLWFELNDEPVQFLGIRELKELVYGIAGFKAVGHGLTLYYLTGDYCKTWRCWASRPTEEERKAAAWMK